MKTRMMKLPRQNFVTGYQAGIRDLPYVKGACESWARWCGGSRNSGISMTGRLMQGARSNVCPGWIVDMQAGHAHDPWCPQCHGTGRLLLKLTATQRAVSRVCPICEGSKKFAGDHCYRCKGAGSVRIIDLKVNPIGIRSTRPGSGVGDWQSLVLDNLITGWRERDETFWMNRVVVREYFWNGTQQMKARQLRVSESFFKKTLRVSYSEIDRALFRKMPRG